MRSTLMTLHDPQLAKEFYSKGLWQDVTLYGMAVQHAASHPERFAIRDSELRLTWAELVSWADALATDLHEAGLQSGDRVAGWLPSRVECVVLLLACSRNGYVSMQALHQNHTVDEIYTLLERCDVRAFVGQPGYGADADRKDIFSRLHSLKGFCQAYVVAPPGTSNLNLPPEAKRFPQNRGVKDSPVPDGNPDKIVYIAFTSGTTGQPKALMHSDNTLLANGRALAADWGLTRETVIYCLGPLSHHIATVGLEQCLITGCEFIVNDQVKGKQPIDRMIESGADYVMGVPTHAIDILQDVRSRGLEQLGRVKMFYMAGAAIPEEVARQLVALGVMPQNIYGMSENGSHNATIPTDSVETLTRTVGQPVGRGNPAYEVKIWKADNRDIEAAIGEVGEIGGRGATLMLGYFGNHVSTQTSFNRHGWFMSGDLGRLDANGNLEIVGRSKDLIIRGGHNIYPAEIENLALRHPGVAKAAAFPVADARLGEKVCLAIIPAVGTAPLSEEILQHLDAVGLSRFDMPEYFLSVEAFPMTASGKILKRELSEQVKDGHLKPAAVRWVGTSEATSA
ncbi:cyclohexanecarboxylate-CoA ligase [Pseudomonas sp. v388]|uniref:class I adenylate-forming enzyme family protein n=1 Tax=Pseudomonas sp. v388 TaxID=2479849 RepID=UPI000F79D628|nr:class I adenylate-forming enzyme family protein [Pseudomonas sp. v388]RRV10475.1 cyclohexanecarboxylate-CoA ligase [Pseudomonas sp. v388]